MGGTITERTHLGDLQVRFDSFNSMHRLPRVQITKIFGEIAEVDESTLILVLQIYVLDQFTYLLSN